MTVMAVETLASVMVVAEKVAKTGSAVALAVTVAKAVADNNRNCGGRQQSTKCGRQHW